MRLLQIIFLLAFTGNSITVRSQLWINEIMATNASGHIDSDFYNFPDWIEIYNSGTVSVDLADFYLSDNIDSTQKWQFPSESLGAGEFYLVYCDKENTGNHTNFGLSAGGETVYLSNAEGIVDEIEFGKQFSNISYGKNWSDSIWYYCSHSTPGSENVVTKAVEQANMAGYSIPAGRYSGSISVSLSGDNVRYSIDGNEPDSSSASYNTSIDISKTTVLKSKNYTPGYLPGLPYANTYFINEHKFSLPVVSLSFTPDYFYDETIGIYVSGSNGTEGNCKGVNNWNQPWERAAYLEYFDTEGIKQISQPVGVKVSGGCTRGRDQKSLSVYARSKYGDNDLDYPFFAEKSHINSYKSLMLRNSGNDQDQTLLRDAFIQALVKPTMDIDAQAYQPTSVYLNGEYFGIMNFREKVDEDYFLTNYGLKSDEIDFLEGVLWSDFDNAYSTIRGSSEEYWTIVDFVSGNSLVSEENYNWVASQLDLQEYINYMTVQIYIGNRDWPGNNLKFWKAKNGGKWRWILFDTDYGFGFRLNDGGASFESFHLVTEGNGDSHPNPPWSTLLFRKLLENESFKKQFLSTFIAHMYSSFDPQWCNFVLDSLASGINTEIDYNQSLYGRTKSQWQGYLNTLKTYAVDRQEFMPGYVESFFSLNSEEVEITIHNSTPHKGGVEINSATLPMYPFTMKTYKELPYTLKAVPKEGYYFSHWEYTKPETSQIASPELGGNTSSGFVVRAVFGPQEPGDNPTDIELSDLKNNIHIFPNPSQGRFNIQIESDAMANWDFQFELVDISGREILSLQKIENCRTVVDVPNLNNGFYFIRILNRQQIVLTKKIILLK